MTPDEEGFLYPKVDVLACMSCGLCEKVCPFLTHFEQRKPEFVYAAINTDDQERRHSSSGGVFSIIARQVLLDGGVVFGAVFDEKWNVCHVAIDDIKYLPRLQGSKYVQSRMDDCYRKAKDYLQKDRQVLFSGTACQIAGLKLYLQNEYPNLISIDVVCHGVPSPQIWNDYITQLQHKTSIKSISFRDKYSGWTNYDFSVVYNDGKIFRESHSLNKYMQGFLLDLYLRPSCHHCNVKGCSCGSDITLGDFWGIEKLVPELKDNMGVSLVLAHSPKGKNMVESASMRLIKASYEQAVLRNSCIEKSTPYNKWRKIFWDHYQKGEGLDKSINYVSRHKRPSIITRIFHRINLLFNKKSESI